MQTDVSDKVWSAVLRTNLNKICGYHSGMFSLTEENYNTIEKEILAITREIKKWRLFFPPICNLKYLLIIKQLLLLLS